MFAVSFCENYESLLNPTLFYRFGWYLDYTKVLHEVRNQKDNEKLNGKFTWGMHIKYFFCIVKTWSMIIILFILPLIWYFSYYSFKDILC